MSATVPPAPTLAEAQRFCDAMLPKVSRTFALSIRFLPGDLGRAVLVAYLLCRIADTVEDDGGADVETKTRLLDLLLEAFDGPTKTDVFVAESQVIGGEADHVELLRGTALVFQAFRALPEGSRAHVRRWVAEMVVGMRKFVRLYPDGIRIQTTSEYKEYCYYVAGTVGHLLTELWREHAPRRIGRRTYEKLLVRCKEFGEALQTVNILKDIAHDAQHENSIYIPREELRAQGSDHATLLSPAHERQNHAAIRGFIDLAWRDLDEALEYTLTIPRSAWAIRVFCVLPLLFAYATLRDLTNSTAMLRSGGTVKISRREVKALMIMGPALILSNAGLRWLVSRVRSKPFVLRPATV